MSPDTGINDSDTYTIALNALAMQHIGVDQSSEFSLPICRVAFTFTFAFARGLNEGVWHKTSHL